MWHIYKDSSVFDSDGYGVSTDNQPSSYEIIDNALTANNEKDISDSFRQWLEDTAREYFNDVGEWDEEFKDAWREKIIEII